MAKPITDVMRLLDGGTFVDIATDALSSAVTAVDETGKAAELVIRIKIKKAPRGTNAMLVTTEVQAKLPKSEAQSTLLYPTPEGSFLRDDPRQTKLDLKEAPGTKTEELKTAAA